MAPANSRKFKQCSTCESELTASTATREHIFGKSVAKRYRNKQRGKVPKVESPTSDKEDWKGIADHPLDYTSHSLCKCCNHAFGEEFSIVKEKLFQFLERKTVVIEGEHFHGSLRYFHRIAMLHDAETCRFDPSLMEQNEADIQFNFAHHTHPPIYSIAERMAFRAGGILPRTEIFVARHDGVLGKTFEMASSRYGQLINNTVIPSRKFLFVIDRLAICILLGNAAHVKTNKFQLFTMNERRNFYLRRESVINEADFFGEQELQQDQQTATLYRAWSDPEYAQYSRAYFDQRGKLPPVPIKYFKPSKHP